MERRRRWPGFGPVLLSLLLAACQAIGPRKPSLVEERVRALDFTPPHQADAARPRRSRPSEEKTRAAELYFGTPVRPRVRSPQPVRRLAEGVEINLDQVSLAQFLEVVLGKVLGASYTFDPGLDAVVSVSSAGPLSEADLLRLVETVLRMHGASLVDLGGSFAVLPLEEATGRAQVLPLGGEPAPLAPGFGVTVVPLRHLAADTAAELIQPMLSEPDAVRVDSARNLLLFTGTGPERRYAVEALRAMDVDWMAGKSAGIFPLSRALPEQLVRELEAVFQPRAEEGSDLPGPRFLPIARLNAVLAIANDREQLLRIQKWVRRLDRGGRDGVEVRVHELAHVAAEEMAKLLEKALAGGAAPIRAQASAAPPEPEPSPSAELTAPAAKPQPEAPAAAPLEGVRIVAVPARNALLLRGRPRTLDMIEATIRRLDRPPLQVLIEASIVEVALNDALRFGVQYFLDAANVRVGFKTTGSTGEAAKTALEPLARLPGFNFIYTGGSANITIDALSRITDLKVLSSPSLVVQDNREATLFVGDEVPIVTRTAQSVVNPDAPIVSEVEFRQTGVILKVKPRINTREIVTLEISQEVSRVTDFQEFRVNENPIIQQRKITSRVNVLSGQTVVLGGLIQDSDSRRREQVPVLGNLPVIGDLFSSSSAANARTELLVFITPRIIRNAEDARAVSEELRDRMRAFRPRRQLPGLVPRPSRLRPPAWDGAEEPKLRELPAPRRPIPPPGQRPAGGPTLPDPS